MISTLIVDGQGWVSIAGEEGTSLRHWTALSTPRPPRAQRPLPRPRWSDLQTFNGDPEKTSFHHNDIVRKSRIITTRFNTTCLIRNLIIWHKLDARTPTSRDNVVTPSRCNFFFLLLCYQYDRLLKSKMRLIKLVMTPCREL